MTAQTDTDERFARITAGAPELDDAVVHELLRERFGLAVRSVSPLAGETDRNHHVVADSGEYVLKVTGDGDATAVEFQTALLLHLAEHAPDLPVPHVVPDRAGATVVPVHDGGRELSARLVTWLPGEPLAHVRRRSPELLGRIGATAGRLAAATSGFHHDRPPEPHYWDVGHTRTALTGAAPHLADDVRGAVARVEARYASVLDRLPELPSAVVHHDLNALNILVRDHQVSGVIDFGDALPTARVTDLAVLLSSVLRGADDPLDTAAALVTAYHDACPLTEAELDAVFPLAALRAATVAATTARLAAERRHGDPRHRSSAAGDLVLALADVPAEVGSGVVRRAAGLPAHRATPAVRSWLAGAPDVSPLVTGALAAVDLSATSELYDGADPRDPAALRAAARNGIRAHTVGRYGEPRFLVPRRCEADVQLGVEVFADTGEPVHAPLAGVVERVSLVGGSVGWDGTAVDGVVLRHEPTDAACFRTVYSGVTATVPAGREVRAGERIGTVAEPTGELPASVRLQVTVADVDDWPTVPATAAYRRREVWHDLFPDPTSLLGGGPDLAVWAPTVDASVAGRQRHLPYSHPMYYSRPISMVRARDCYFYDEQGRSYLDALNNVTLVGHCHPRLVDVASRQLGRLNTNTRFVYDVLTEYAQRLTATLPDGLDVVYFVNSGSEANDLALRMARHLSGRQDVVIIDDAYHGYTSTVADVSPSRYRHYGKPGDTHPTPVPDRYRGAYGYGDPEAGAKYAAHVVETFDELAMSGRPPAAYLFEALLAGGGQVVLPPGYLEPIFAAAAERGIYTIADEVQVGFGRLGEAFWGFATQGSALTPDFVTMGKAMGNGFPMAALVTTREISERFDAAGRFFSTYGGNPVACAVGLELLDIVEDEGLQHNALTVGTYLTDRLGELVGRHEPVGDVRGQGLYCGVELVRDRGSKEPATEETLRVCERMKDLGVLVYPTGPAGNVLKLKPPLTFTREHADEFTARLDETLEAGW